MLQIKYSESPKTHEIENSALLNYSHQKISQEIAENSILKKAFYILI